jgi:hypothetical protein
MKTIPLSLHTRRAVGVLAYTVMLMNQGMTADRAVSEAFELLGYDEGTPDVHGLRAQVLADVSKASQS